MVTEKVKFSDPGSSNNHGNVRINPPLCVPFIFHQHQVVEIQVWTDDEDYFGCSKFMIGELVGSRSNSLELEMFGGTAGLDREEFINRQYLVDMQ